MSRIAIFCPGRGSYVSKSLGSLEPGHPLVAIAEELRASYGLKPLLELDRASKIDVAAENISPLIYVCTMLDAATAMKDHQPVCVGGNSMGWYTALAVAGALSFEDGFRLVQEMALLQEERTGQGGQVVYPVMDEQWRRDPLVAWAGDNIRRASNGEVFESIHLGGYEVLAGTERGVERLLKQLPRIELGQATFPFRLKGHGPYHTPLLQGVAQKAQRQLAKLDFRTPAITLIDGRGQRHTPWSTDPAELAAYTLGEQVTTPFDFTASVRVALREYAPDMLALPGPGNSLGGPCGQVLVQEKWNGIESRADFEAAPGLLVWSLRR